jgi:hypothetical protein
MPKMKQMMLVHALKKSTILIFACISSNQLLLSTKTRLLSSTTERIEFEICKRSYLVVPGLTFTITFSFIRPKVPGSFSSKTFLLISLRAG